MPTSSIEMWQWVTGGIASAVAWMWARIQGTHKRISDLERATLTSQQTADFVDRAIKPLERSVDRIEQNVQKLVDKEMNRK